MARGNLICGNLSNLIAASSQSHLRRKLLLKYLLTFWGLENQYRRTWSFFVCYSPQLQADLVTTCVTAGELANCHRIP